MTRVFRVKVGSKWHTVEVEDLTTSPIRVLVDGEPVDVDIDGMSGGSAQAEVSATSEAEEVTAPSSPPTQTGTDAGAVNHTIRAPMPGVIISIRHIIGDRIAVGEEACVLEAMKMQQSIRSDGAGTILRILVQPGQQVQGGEALIELS